MSSPEAVPPAAGQIDPFTRAGLNRIALPYFGDADAARRDDDIALVVLADIHAFLPSLDDVARFAGLIELGVRFGYLDLTTWSGKNELRSLVGMLVDTADPPVSPYDWLYWRLDEQGRDRFSLTLKERREPRLLACFEAYLRLDEDVHGDADLLSFVAASWPRELWPVDAIFLGRPEFFAEAFATGRVRHLQVGGQAAGGVAASRALERLANLLDELDDRPQLGEALLRHARWARRADLLRLRLAGWADRAREWVPYDAAASEPWRDYDSAVLLPLVGRLTALAILDGEAVPAEGVETLTEGELPRLAREAIGILSRLGDDLSQDDLNDFWWRVKGIIELGDLDTASALAAAVPRLRLALRDPADRELYRRLVSQPSRLQEQIAAHEAETAARNAAAWGPPSMSGEGAEFGRAPAAQPRAAAQDQSEGRSRE